MFRGQVLQSYICGIARLDPVLRSSFFVLRDAGNHKLFTYHIFHSGTFLVTDDYGEQPPIIPGANDSI